MERLRYYDASATIPVLYDQFIHLRDVLSPEELERAQEAADRYINSPPEEMPIGFGERDVHGNH